MTKNKCPRRYETQAYRHNILYNINYPLYHTRHRYSVGAHIAGLTSNFINSGKIGRITGLDPTIIFYMSNNRSRDLDPTDAHFVDIIHTAAGILGQWGPSGHADFYVNGGTSQPGCASNSIIREYGASKIPDTGNLSGIYYDFSNIVLIIRFNG